MNYTLVLYSLSFYICFLLGQFPLQIVWDHPASNFPQILFSDPFQLIALNNTGETLALQGRISSERKTEINTQMSYYKSGSQRAVFQETMGDDIYAPQVLILTPATASVIQRRAHNPGDDLSTIPPTSVLVVASVTLPGNEIRSIRQADLLVNGIVVNSLINPNPPTELELAWSIRGVQEPGRHDFLLQVEVLDEMGILSRSPAITVIIEVIVPPGSSPSHSGTTLERAIPIISLGVALFSLIFAGIVWVNRDKAPVRAVTDKVRRGIDTITKRYLGPTEARAYVVVLEGDVHMGKTLEIYGDTPMGRSRQTAELIFQQYDDNSPISRLHCTITDEEDHFTIKDEDSANGTFLNGTKLLPLTPEVLYDGDEFELGRVERGGVRLLFQLAAPSNLDGQAGSATKKFRSVSTPTVTENENEQAPKRTIKPRF